MSRSYETNADLVIAIQTLNTSLFKSVLYKVTVPITTLCDHCGANVFHEMAGILLPESVEIEFLSIFVTFCYKNYEENALDVLKICLNRQTATELLTPLMIATGNNKLALVKEYIKYGADVNAKSFEKQTITHIASANGLIQMLVYFKYDLEIPIGEIDSNGKAPIHLAIEKGKEALVVLLISWGADLEMKDKENNTLLHYAAITNNFRLAKLLIIRGANRKSYNSEGKSPYTLAEEQGYTDILRILVKFT